MGKFFRDHKLIAWGLQALVPFFGAWWWLPGCYVEKDSAAEAKPGGVVWVLSYVFQGYKSEGCSHLCYKFAICVLNGCEVPSLSFLLV